MFNVQTILLLLVNISTIFYLQAIEINKNSILKISLTSPIIEIPVKIVSVEEKAKAISVKIVAEDSWGTGILINQQDNIYTVLTNAHVVRDENITYQIQTVDKKLYPATDRLSEKQLQDYDLALLTFSSEEKYTIATFGNNPQEGEKVIAVGFPYSYDNSASKEIVYSEGIVWQMLPKPMKDGYQLGYSSLVRKGMSGGAVMNMTGEVVAINGMHPYPLWGNPYIYQDGDIPNEPMLEQMSEYSWGIPVERVKDAIELE